MKFSFVIFAAIFGTLSARKFNEVFEYSTDALKITDLSTPIAYQFTVITDGNSNKEDITITFAATNYVFDNCTITHPKGSARVTYTIHILALSTTTNAAVDLVAVALGIGLDNPQTTLTTVTVALANTGANFKTCGAQGDPHYVSFLGTAYDCFAQGTVYMIKSTNLDVQGSYVPSGSNGATIANSIAVRYYSSLYIFTMSDDQITTQIVINDANVNIQTMTPSSFVESGVDSSLVDTALTIGFPDGLSIQLANFNKYCLDISLTVPSIHYNGGTGLCGDVTNNIGSFDSTQWGQFAVSDGENFFTKGAGSSRFTGVQTFAGFGFNTCSLPPLPIASPSPKTTLGAAASATASPIAASASNSVATTTTTTTTSPVVSSPSPTGQVQQGPVQQGIISRNFTPVEQVEFKVVANPKIHFSANSKHFQKEAINLCSNIVYTDHACNAIVDPKPFFHACVQDILLTGDMIFADSARRSYMFRCRGILTVSQKDANTKHTIQDDAIAKSAGLDSNPCPGGCGTGFCSSIGCTCPSNYIGNNCETKVAPPSDQGSSSGALTGKVPSLSSVLNTIQGAMSSVKVPVSGNSPASVSGNSPASSPSSSPSNDASPVNDSKVGSSSGPAQATIANPTSSADKIVCSFVTLVFCLIFV